MRERRADLGLSFERVEAQGGPVKRTQFALEQGEAKVGIRRGTLAKIDTGLRWREGSAEAVLRGGNPEPLPDEVDLRSRMAQLWEEESRELRDTIERIRMLGAQSPPLSEARHLADTAALDLQAMLLRRTQIGSPPTTEERDETPEQSGVSPH